jgi:hypothetical protein
LALSHNRASSSFQCFQIRSGAAAGSAWRIAAGQSLNQGTFPMNATIFVCHRAIDGSLSCNPEAASRIETVAEMADDLIKADAFRVRGDAIDILRPRYTTFEIMACVDDAIAVATQHVVAMEMSDQ